jgi:hypothetical protein
MMEGTSCSFTLSSLIVSSTLILACFGIEELGLKNQEKGENSIKTINSRQQKALARPRKALYLGVSSSSPPNIALALCFRVATLGPLWVTRQRVTNRRALALLGGLCFFALHHIHQGAVVIGVLVILLVH